MEPNESNRPQQIADIAVPVALAHALSYAVPDELVGRVQPGHRVRLRLRGRSTFGFVLGVRPRAELPPHIPPGALKAFEKLDPETVLLDPPLLDLARWISRYYVAPIGIALETAVPRSVARPPRGRAADEDAADEGSAAGRSATEEEAAAAKPAPVVGTTACAFALNPAQRRAVEALTAALEARSGGTFLLHGVTGSGKTEVYLHAMQAALERGLSVLFLVPEIALGTQIVRWVRDRFGALVAEYHSQLTPGERRRSWWRAHGGEARVVVGARSAVFAPMRRLGLVVVDEEHEPSYKQTETPRYHGRDTALMRARLEGAVTVLGSATPSLETTHNAERGKYTRLELPERVDARPQPEVTLVDLRREPGEETPSGLRLVSAGVRDPLDPLAPYLLQRLEATLAAGDQAILFLNRRGFSTCVQCRSCGHVFECPRCSVTLTHHRSERVLRCHYCNHLLRNLTTCPGCGGSDFAYTGFGTQRVEDALAHHLPDARVLRMDLDSTRRRGTMAQMVTAFERGEADVLLGTQMVAKGFDFPRVTLVGVINADREMGLPDFRGQERAFQLLTQVAGRAGRGTKAGEVVFQTYLPDHHVIWAAGRQDYRMFFEREVEERRPLNYPPHSRLANLLFDGPDEQQVTRRAMAEADRLGRVPGLMLLGPAPMPLSRLKGQYRWHLTLIAPQARLLSQALHQAIARAQAARARGRVRVQVDVDPVSML